MKKNVLFCLLLLSFVSFGQSKYFLFDVGLKENSILNLPKNIELKELYFKNLIKLLSNNDGLIVDSNSDYVLLSDFYISEATKANAGYLPIVNCKINLTLSLKYKSGGLEFKSLTISKEHFGNNQKDCLLKFINGFNLSSNELSGFFNRARENNVELYKENCNNITKNVKKYQSIGEPEKALAICLSIPVDNNCYDSATNIIKDLYTIISYNLDYKNILKAQDFVSKEQYENAFKTLNEISKYSKFYNKSEQISEQINNYLFLRKELQNKKELTDSENNLKKSEIELQQKRNELQESINQTNITIANDKNESDRVIASKELENQKEMKILYNESQERKEMIKTAENLLNSYINRPQPKQDTNFYIIK
jgi:hypothetical protein